MVDALHAAGIEVVLDVVYNHTCEQSVDGISVSWRGLDGPGYYLLDGDGRDIDLTGCGNTVDACSPIAVRMNHRQPPLLGHRNGCRRLPIRSCERVG